MNLLMYYFPTCPYCKRVLSFLKKNNLLDKIILKNIHENPVYEQELIKIGGKKQVPCLFINGEPLYESMSIIEWFEKNF